MKKKLKKRWLYILIGTGLLIGFFYFQNNSIVISEHTITSNKLPGAFDGYNIIHLSDLHNKSFRDDQNYLVNKVKKADPDLIVFTGDLIDSRRYDEEPSLLLMDKLVEIAPIYYVTGNHEWRTGTFATLEKKLVDLGVHVLRNTSQEITIGSESITIMGVDDPLNKNESATESAVTKKNISWALDNTEEKNSFQILLAHRPELFSLYSEHGLDLVFSGHAHGGQFRLPFAGGLIAPDQGLFPEYTAGKHELNNTRMLVSRGLGNSIIPVRIFNRPEIIVVTLHAE
ncbi:metallophosphoesterase [Oceanobacillus kapialis]|uniref:metallophosphoesterase n=1 Tax=Oceanobacillus kapialis TaxID=481353 RepID=UPI00384D0BEF